jgi:hypothetical protein
MIATPHQTGNESIQTGMTSTTVDPRDLQLPPCTSVDITSFVVAALGQVPTPQHIA